MKNFLLLVLIVLANPLVPLAQDLDALSRDQFIKGVQNEDPNTPNMIGAVLAEGVRKGFDNGIPFTVYQSAENIRDNSNEKDPNYGRNWAYAIQPSFKVTRVQAELNSPSGYFVSVTLTPLMPNLSTVQRLISSPNKNVDIDNIRPVQAHAMLIKYAGAESFERICSGGCDLDAPITIKFRFADQESAKLAARDIQETPSLLNFSVFLNYKESTRDYFRFSREDFMNSSVFRDFYSPIEGKQISVLQYQVASAAMQREMNVLIKQESQNNDFFDKALNDVWSLLVDPRKIVIPFEELTKAGGALGALTNFSNDKRYATDLIKQIAFDAKNMSDSQFASTYSTSNSSNFENEKHKIIGVKTKGEALWGLMDGAFDYTYNNKTRLKEEAQNQLAQSDSGRKIIENSFKYDWTGERYEPKGILAYEVVNFSALSKNIFDLTHNRYYNTRKPVGIQIHQP